MTSLKLQKTLYYLGPGVVTLFLLGLASNLNSDPSGLSALVYSIFIPLLIVALMGIWLVRPPKENTKVRKFMDATWLIILICVFYFLINWALAI